MPSFLINVNRHLYPHPGVRCNYYFILIFTQCLSPPTKRSIPYDIILNRVDQIFALLASHRTVRDSLPSYGSSCSYYVYYSQKVHVGTTPYLQCANKAVSLVATLQIHLIARFFDFKDLYFLFAQRKRKSLTLLSTLLSTDG